ncbi:helix-turn-helix domain-containing protein [Paenalkalicoccus suaedae]|uniref:Helix-turn-helix domain-containing protein n=1 Tax=Paenalkalicoccus suaedae TaxID=2592382 RepID=A0A859FJG3_9BACI|nr:helix-turn-helix domain-containing protein [Paenalkalicoccus suaedae]QKS72941.1 helix-turn-helix domain-containing protein [Paenalkalicoccus suaedae]
MDKLTFGATIERIRKERFMSQKQLAAGICTQAAISRIEKGLVYPKIDTLYLIATKLDVPIDYFIDVLTNTHRAERNAFISMMEDLLAEQKFEKIYPIVEEHLENDDGNDYWLAEFMRWLYHLSSFHTERTTLEEAVLRLKKLLDKNENNAEMQGQLYKRINNSIAYLLATNGQYDTSLYYFEKVLKKKEELEHVKPTLQADIFRIRVMYNKAKTLFDMGSFEESLKTIEEGIEESLNRENMSLLGQFYYYKGQCYEQLNYKEDEIRECYQKALFFFETLDKKLYSRLIWQHKKQYL